MLVTAGLAGRRRALRAVTDVLNGAPGVAALVVAGEAGIGKSRLVTAASEVAAEVTVLPGWCLQLSEGLPFLPIVDILRGLSEVDGGELFASVVSECPEFVRVEIARLLPELDETGDQQAAKQDDEWRRQRLFEAVRRLIHAAGRRRRLGTVVEDLHWADRTTLDLIDYLLAPGHITTVPIVMTCRTEEMPTPDWLERLLRNSNVHRLDLPPLSRAETVDQIELLIGERPSPALADETYRRSEGNAFFTEQLVSSAVGRRLDSALPTGVTSLLLARTAQVPPAGRAVLEVLAVASRPMDEASLRQLCAQTEAELRDVLRDLLSRRLLRWPDAVGRHQLRHALLAEAISGDMLPDARRDLHVKIADVLLGWNDRTLAAQIAEHFAAAGHTRDEFRWRLISAQQAEAVFASDEAAAHWQRAIALWDDVTDAETLARMDLATVYLRAVTSVESAGHQAAAAALVEEALSRLATTASPESAMGLHAVAGRHRSIESEGAGLQALTTAIEIGERLAPTTSRR